MLTPREIQVLRLLSCGCTYAKIGTGVRDRADTEELIELINKQ